jgi:hypothetical protein
MPCYAVDSPSEVMGRRRRSVRHTLTETGSVRVQWTGSESSRIGRWCVRQDYAPYARRRGAMQAAEVISATDSEVICLPLLNNFVSIFMIQKHDKTLD